MKCKYSECETKEMLNITPNLRFCGKHAYIYKDGAWGQICNVYWFDIIKDIYSDKFRDLILSPSSIFGPHKKDEK
jgi:hypothetical protein